MDPGSTLQLLLGFLLTVHKICSDVPLLSLILVVSSLSLFSYSVQMVVDFIDLCREPAFGFVDFSLLISC